MEGSLVQHCVIKAVSDLLFFENVNYTHSRQCTLDYLFYFRSRVEKPKESVTWHKQMICNCLI